MNFERESQNNCKLMHVSIQVKCESLAFYHLINIRGLDSLVVLFE